MKELVDQTLEKLLPSQNGPLFEAARYSLEEGKRLRPLLTLATVQTFEKSIEGALQPSCALEMIHTYSLIHDDLPCMDDDDFRRGRPSLHKAYPESHAILTGDFLLTYAFEVLANAPSLSAKQKNQLIATLALRSGSNGMIGGQVLDIENQQTTPKQLLNTHMKKTGALITAALEFGGIIAGQSDLSHLQAIGEALGLAYQLVDDILDGDGAVSLLGEKETETQVSALFEKAQTLIRALPKSAPLEAIAKNMLFRSV